MNSMPDWVTGFPGGVTVSDANNKVIFMNDAAARTWESKGGKDLVGKDLSSCHNEHSREIIANLLATGGTNIYTIEKGGVRKLIYHCAWRDSSGKVAGLVDLSLVLPDEIPSFDRD